MQSLDTNDSVNGGVAVYPPSLQVLEICLEALTAADRASDTSQHKENAVEDLEPIPNVKDTHQILELQHLLSSAPDISL